MFQRRQFSQPGLVTVAAALAAALDGGASVNAALLALRAEGEGAAWADLLRRHVDLARMVLPTTQVDRRQSWQPCAARRRAAPCEEEFAQLAVAIEAGAAHPAALRAVLRRLLRHWCPVAS